MITLDLPPEIQKTIIITAEKQGISVNDYILNAIKTTLHHDTPKHIDDVLTFDMEVMKERLKGFESKEEALKNGILVPKFETIEELRHWTRNVLPTLGKNVWMFFFLII